MIPATYSQERIAVLETDLAAANARIQELETAFRLARVGRWKDAEFWAKLP